VRSGGRDGACDGFVSRGRLRFDTSVGVLFAGTFAFGVLLFSTIRNYVQDLLGYLLGNVLGISLSDLVQLSILSVVVLAIVLLIRKELLYATFDPLGAAASGLPVARLEYLLLALLGVTIVVSIQAVGIIMVVAMLVTPAATAQLLVVRFGKMMALAVVIAALSAVIGLYLSFYLNLASGASIVLIETVIFGVALLLSPRSGLLGRRPPEPATLTGQPPAARLGRGRHPFAGTRAGDGERRGDNRATRGIREVQPAGESRRDRPVERVACPDGIHHMHGRPVQGRGSVGRHEQRPVRAEGHQHGTRRVGRHERGCQRSRRRGFVVAQYGQLATVRREDIGKRQERRVKIGRRRRIEDRRRPGRASQTEGLSRRFGRDLVADEDDVPRPRFDDPQGIADLFRAERDVGPPATATVFSPLASTVMSAKPVASRSSVTRPRRSIPSASSAARASAPKASPPTAPTNAVSAPSRAAATA
jgi:ABC-type Mn2+/Zn2+ transport system permease subunit